MAHGNLMTWRVPDEPRDVPPTREAPRRAPFAVAVPVASLESAVCWPMVCESAKLITVS